MEIANRYYTFVSSKETYRIIPIGDVHIGAKGCDETAFDETVARVAADDHTLALYMGDMAECILHDDPRWDGKSVADWCFEPANRANIAVAQRDRLIASLNKIPKERVLGVIEGNHELKLRAKHHLDLTLDLARELGVPYLGEEAFISLVFRKGNSETSRDKSSRRFVLFATHGHGGGRKLGGKVNKMTDTSSFIDADILFMGHHHDRTASHTVMLSLDRGGHLVTKHRLQVLTGSYLKTYQEGSPSYGARELYPPTVIGSPTVIVRPEDRHIEVVV